MAKKENLVKIECAFCKGRGLDPFELLSKMAKCQVCGGRGKVWVARPYRKCSYCNGTGVHSPDIRVPCQVCGGRGVVAEKKGKTCPECKGTSRESESDLPCLACGGTGVI